MEKCFINFNIPADRFLSRPLTPLLFMPYTFTHAALSTYFIQKGVTACAFGLCFWHFSVAATDVAADAATDVAADVAAGVAVIVGANIFNPSGLL